MFSHVFAEGKKQIFQNETLREIGARYGKSSAQVILRWNIQRDMLAISRLDEGVTLFGKNEDLAYAKMINSVKIHGEQ